MPRPVHNKTQTASVRIIAGRFRGRKLKVAAVAGLRPSGDRIRETLFNWLMHAIPGAVCLDLFAGTGVLGLEALSRGAARVVSIEQDPLALRQLVENSTLLAADNHHILHRDALDFLSMPCTAPFDIVFIDPPFHRGLVPRCLQALQQGHYVKPGGVVYVETEAALTPTDLPTGYIISKNKTAGAVYYHLLTHRL
jgi:16S rRNA (guanine966-N2)-methyltransferase